MSPVATMPELLRLRSLARPDDVFLEEAGGARWTNREFYEETLKVADALATLGVRRGDRVASMLDPGARAHSVWLGACWAGAVEAPLNVDYRGALLAHALNDSRAAVLVTTAEYAARLAVVADRLTALRTVVFVDEHVELPWETCLLDDLLRVAHPAERPAPAEYDPYAVVYTSGTTGPSKGVLTPWASLHLTVEATFPGDRPGEYPGGAIYSPWPVFHGLGKYALVVAAELGLRVVQRPRFSVSAFWDDIREHGCTHVHLMGFGALLLNRPGRPDDAANPLRRAVMLPLPVRFREFERRFGVRISTAWGMTEIGLPISTGDPVDPAACGRLLPGFEARLVDNHDYDVPDGQPGEFVIRSTRPWRLMTEYLGRPEATARAWRNGWLHTGDILRRDPNGQYYFVDRKADYLRSRGQNISSLEVEATVAAHPEVEACACIGVPSELGEDDVKVVVIRDDDSGLTEPELLAYLIEHLPRFMVPRYIEFTDGLPRTPTGKVRKAELRETPVTPGTWDREAAGIAVPR
ncbi:AMP-binding protein [Amycolatopsis acidicola]|uniref:AMP-binding protein n=1 Tax=Amycolatopsis acidicola TaxID=2596893 RepID=A0A5N0UXS2_9PSEU|nr:AMP-binding protein [Amycolatopsis acidicola]KAA9157336.1 AMP-binding protein [Amycolatopsis acidicola]